VLAEKVYIGSRLDLEHYKGIAIQEHEFELLDIDGEPVDLSIYDSFNFCLYDKPHGKLLECIDMDFPSPMINSLYLSATASQVNRRPKLYFYESKAYQEDSSPEIPTLLFYGVFEMI
jgi:hypothetical protein